MSTDISLTHIVEETAGELTAEDCRQLGHNDGYFLGKSFPPCPDPDRRQAYVRGYAEGLIARSAESMKPPTN